MHCKPANEPEKPIGHFSFRSHNILYVMWREMNSFEEQCFVFRLECGRFYDDCSVFLTENNELELSK